MLALLQSFLEWIRGRLAKPESLSFVKINGH